MPPRPAVHGDRRRACLLGTLRHFHGVKVFFVPTDTNFDCYGYIAARAHNGSDDLFGKRRIAHQCCTPAVARDLRCGAAHVDVHKLRVHL